MRYHLERFSSLIFGTILVFAAVFAHSQTSVVLAPLPRLQFFDQSGRPLTFGCVFAFVSGTTTPLATYTDSTGNTQNANPVILSAGGAANIWLLAGQSYSLRIKSAGGVNCASGATLYTADGIGGGGSQLVTPVAYAANITFSDVANNQLFTLTLTGNAVSLPLNVVGVSPPAFVSWQITQDGTGGRTFTWPANVSGAAPIGLGANQTTTQMFLWDGTHADAVGPATISSSPVTAASGPLTVNGNPVPSTLCSNGVPVTVNANTTNAQGLQSCVIPAGTLNSIGKSLRFTGEVNMHPASNITTQVSFPFYGGANVCNMTTNADKSCMLQLTCTTTVTGSSGQMQCGGFVTGTNTANMTPFGNITLDLTISQTLQLTCAFGSASASNTCTGFMLIAELLN